jgi:UDP:flavonoid glycosyltransferase YjiC (YdhE family)
MRALAHGVPLLILPMHRALDQPMIGRAIAAAGVGQVLPKTASAEEIRRIVRSLLQDASYRHAAAEVATRLRLRNGAIAAADEIESLLKARRDSARSAA